MAEPEMDLNTACDWAASYVARNVRPWEKIDQVLRVAREAEHRARVAEAATAQAQRGLEQYRAALASAKEADTKALDLQKAATAARLEELRDTIARAQTETTERLALLEQERQTAEREHAVKLEALRAAREQAESVTRDTVTHWETRLNQAKASHDAFLRSVGVPG